MSPPRSDRTDDGNCSNNNEGGVPDHEENKIVLKDDSVRHFKMKRTMRFKKLMKSYCELQNLDLYNTVFFCYARRLNPEQTPDELDMEDGDEIEALIGWPM
ncbi:PREDICTED: small ubiquitin-related modifier 1-like isoform X2 [Camelina sativa]|uniref:Small ubiquitin-related modifier 1-like isoform X2 n=1 Tax=Camelina sativa TaxID=90675 RepID=A0ABM1QUP2_CAMSA|nr:PREDICTED: small ubiquitin-related modifier 1-like isoform X2 [Camelina sativa]XP_019090480.1 PREDICTED: small ubiquitin-related modifier 1-like isoform X2 [Camelina sativa]